MWYPDKWRVSNYNFKVLKYIKFLNRIKFIYSLDSRIRLLVPHLSWNKLTLVRRTSLFFLGWWIAERLNSVQIYSLDPCFLVRELVLQICHWLNGHTFYSKSADDISENINLEKNELENLISFKFEFYTLFFVLYFIRDIFHLCKKLRGVRCRLTKA